MRFRPILTEKRENDSGERNDMANNENLRPFNTLPPEELREISRKGGLASGKRRRAIADMKSHCKLYIAKMQLSEEIQEDYRQAIMRYAREERKKMARRKKETKKAP